MTTTPCPACGHPTTAEALACPSCGHALANGAIPQTQPPPGKPLPPPEVSSWVIEKTPPEVLEELRRTFDMEEFLAGTKEIEQTGGVRFEALIGEIEEIVKRRG